MAIDLHVDLCKVSCIHAPKNDAHKLKENSNSVEFTQETDLLCIYVKTPNHT